MRMIRIVFTLVIAVTASVVMAQAVDPALTAAMAARDKAIIARDADTVARYTADDFGLINGNGQLMNKQQRVSTLRSPATGPTPSSELRTETVRMYGASVAVGRLRSNGARQLVVWAKNPQGWQNVAVQIVGDAVPPAPAAQEPPKVFQPTPVATPAGVTGDRAAVFAAWKAMQDAVYAGDREADRKLKAPDFVRILPGGLMRFGSETFPAVSVLRVQPKYSNVSVQVWNQVGVVRWLETTAAGQSQWLTRVLAKNAAGWQQVTTASSPAGTPPVAP